MVNAADKAKLSMLGALDEEELDDHYLDGIDEEMEFQGEQAAERKKKKALAKGRLRLFSMPEKANGTGGTRIATGRILRPLKFGLKIVEHDKWAQSKEDSFTIVCPGEIGLRCTLCEKICKKKGITREALVANARSLAEYASKKEWGFRTQYMHYHYFWYNEENNGDGAMRILFGALNEQSPMGGIHQLNLTRFVNAKVNPLEIDQYDIKLIQTSEGMTKRFNVLDIDKYEFDNWEAVAEAVGHPLDKKHLKWDAIIARTWDAKLITKYKAMAYEELGDESYKPDDEEADDEDGYEEEEEVTPSTRKNARANGKSKKQDDEEVVVPTSELDIDLD